MSLPQLFEMSMFLSLVGALDLHHVLLLLFKGVPIMR